MASDDDDERTEEESWDVDGDADTGSELVDAVDVAAGMS